MYKRQEQGEEEYQPAKPVRITKVPKEKEKIKEEPEVLQVEKEPEEIIPEKSEEETEAPEETEEISEASVIEPEPETEPEIKEEPAKLTNEPESIEESVQEIVSKEPLEDVYKRQEYDEETKQYQKYLGEINAKLAGWAQEVTEVVYGIPVQYKKTENKEGQKNGKIMEQL